MMATVLFYCAVLPLIYLFYERLFAICLTLLLRVLLWGGAIQLVRTKKKRTSGIGGGGIGGGVIDEWSIEHDLWGLLRYNTSGMDNVLSINRSLRTALVTPSVGTDDVERLRYSLTPSSCDVSSIRILPIVSAYHPTRRQANRQDDTDTDDGCGSSSSGGGIENQFYLLSLSLHDIQFSVNLSVQVMDDCHHEYDAATTNNQDDTETSNVTPSSSSTSSTTTMNLELSFRLEWLKFYLGSPAFIALLPFRLLRFLRNSIDVAKVRQKLIDVAGSVSDTNVDADTNADVDVDADTNVDANADGSNDISESKPMVPPVGEQQHHNTTTTTNTTNTKTNTNNNTNLTTPKRKSTSLQYKLSILSKILGGIDLHGMTLQLKATTTNNTQTKETSTTNETVESPAIEPDGLDCCLAIKHIGIRLLDGTSKSSGEDESMTNVTVSSNNIRLGLDTRIGGGRHSIDDDDENTLSSFSITNDSLLIAINVVSSSNDTDTDSDTAPMSFANVTMTRGNSTSNTSNSSTTTTKTTTTTCGEDDSVDIAVSSSLAHITSLLNTIQHLVVNPLAKVVREQILVIESNTSNDNDNDNDNNNDVPHNETPKEPITAKKKKKKKKAKSPMIVLDEFSSAVGIQFHFLDNSRDQMRMLENVQAGDRAAIDSISLHRVEMSTKAIVMYTKTQTPTQTVDSSSRGDEGSDTDDETNSNDCIATTAVEDKLRVIICHAGIRQNSQPYPIDIWHDTFSLGESTICQTKQYNVLSNNSSNKGKGVTLQRGAHIGTNDETNKRSMENTRGILRTPCISTTPSSVTVDLGNILVNFDDSRKIDRILRIGNLLKTCATNNDVKRILPQKESTTASSTSTTTIISTSKKKRKQNPPLYLSCGIIKISIPFQNPGQEGIDDGDDDSRRDILQYFLKIEGVALKLASPDPCSQLDVVETMGGGTVMALSVTNISISLTFTPHTNLPTHAGYYDEKAVLTSTDSKSTTEKAETHFVRREDILASRQTKRVKFGLIFWYLDVTLILPASEVDDTIAATATAEQGTPGPKIDISIRNIVGNEHVDYCEDDESLGEKTNFLHSNGLDHITIDSQTFGSPNDDLPQTTVESVLIETHGSAFKVVWSPILMWFIVSALHKSNAIVRHYKSLSVSSTSTSSSTTTNRSAEKKKEKMKKRVQTNVEIRTNETVLDAKIYLAGGSLVNMITKNVVITASHDITDTWKKPSVQVKFGETQVHFNERYLSVIKLHSFRLGMILRLASDKEVTTFLDQGDDDEDLDDVLSDTDGKPLFLTFEIKTGKYVQVNLPPVLQLGHIIDDISPTHKATIVGLQSAGLAEPKSSAKKKYEMMDIIVSIPMVNAILHEAISDTMIDNKEVGHKDAVALRTKYPKTRFGRSRDHKSMLERSRIHVVGLMLTIKRNTPKATTQSHIRGLDEDKKCQYVYGPIVDGGDMSLQIGHIIWILHPLSMAIPFVTIKNANISGLFHLSRLDPSTEGLIEGRTFTTPVKCHHKCCSNLRTPDTFGCLYGAERTTSGIPNKIFIDLLASFQEVHITFGPIVSVVMQNLQNIIQRIIPKPAEGPPRITESIGLPPKAQWWDDLRYQFHGNICFKMDQISFRWLLDTVAKYDWSILLTSNNLSLNHSTGVAELSMEETIVSVPGTSYHMVEADIRRSVLNAQHSIDYGETENSFRRQSLLLLPSLELALNFEWQVLSTAVRSIDHHSVYMKMKSNAEICPSSVPFDKFNYFRSHGVQLFLNISLSKNSEFATWVALRADVLPWLTHKQLDLQRPKSSGNSDESLPKINGIEISLEAVGLKIAAWFDENGVLSTNKTLNGKENDSTDNEGICLTVPQLHFSLDSSKRKRIDFLGTSQAGLFNIIDFLGEDKGQINQKSFFLETTTESNNYYEKSNLNLLVCFERLEYSLQQMKSLDYVLCVDQINVFDQALEEIKNPPSSTLSSNEISSTDNPGLEKIKPPWTVLVAGLRLLWTLEIRESFVPIVKDLLFAINFMKVNLRGTPQSLTDHEEKSTVQNNLDKDIKLGNVAIDFTNTDIYDHNGRCATEVQSSDPIETKNSPGNSPVQAKSHLNYLLTGSNESSNDDSSSFSAATAPSLSNMQDEEVRSNHDFLDPVEKSIIPTFDLQLANPQIQLHSPRTGGSVILAIRGAYVEGKKFLKLFAIKDALENDDLRAETLLRRTQFVYTLDRMEVYSLNGDIDVDLGLQWLRTQNDVDRKQLVLPRQHKISALSKKDDVEYSPRRKNISELSDKDYLSLELTPSVIITDNGNWSGMGKISDGSENIFPLDLGLERHETSDFIEPYPFKKIMNQSTFKTRQEFHKPPIDLTQEELAETIRRKMVESLNDEIEPNKAIETCELFVDELSFLLDSYQFGVTLDVIRNVLLEPPKVPKERYYNSLRPDLLTSKMSDSLDAKGNKYKCMEESLHAWAATSVHPKKIRDSLRLQAKEIIEDIEENKENTVEPSIRRIEYNLSKAKLRMITPGFVDDIEIAFTGFRGLHDFTADGSVNSLLSLEDMHVSSLQPGPDALGFHDPTAIIKTAVGVEKSPCQRCGLNFDRKFNELTSCVFHPGSFRQSVNHIPSWTCCSEPDKGANGCTSKPHTGTERVVEVKFDALPRKVDGLTTYRHVEANIYPITAHTLVVQLTENLAKTFAEYFLGDSTDIETSNPEPSRDRNANVSETSSDTMENLSTLDGSNRDGDVGGKKALLFGKAHVSKKESAVNTVSKPVADESSLTDKKKGGAEMLFIKYWRVGEININFSVTGFKWFVNASDKDLFVPSFQRIFKIGSVQHLNRKLIAHYIKSLVSAGAALIGDKLFRNTPGKHGPYICDNPNANIMEESDEEGEHDDVSLHRQKDMLLGQPSSKNSKQKKSRFSRLRKKISEKK